MKIASLGRWLDRQRLARARTRPTNRTRLLLETLESRDLPAPVLATTAVAFPGIQENATSNLTNPGTSLPTFLSGLTITGPDSSSTGIAVNGVDDSHGTWQFTIDNGKTWTPFSNLSDTQALLLADNPLDRIRFVPAINYVGPSTFTFRAWDQTGGVDSGFGDAIPNGGTTGFSAAVGTATIKVVAPVQDLVGRVQTASATGPVAGSWLVSVSNGSSALAPTKWDGWTPDQPGQLDWVNVMTGDFNGDGRDDIVGRDRETGTWWVALSNGANGFTTSMWDAWSPDVPGKFDWVDVQTGDFNGDGKTDIIGRVLETGEWWVALSTGTSFITSHWDTWSVGTSDSPITWVDVHAGDVTGDGKSDIVGRVSQTGAWYVGVSTGTAFATRFWDAWSPIAWADVRLVDLTGDGRDDLIGMVPQTGQWWAAVSTGAVFRTSFWGTWNPAVVNNLTFVEAGDFNGDGKVDLSGYDAVTGQWFTSLSTGTGLTAVAPWTSWDPKQTWIDVQVGDFNGDGQADIVGLNQKTGQWQMNLSTGSAFAKSLWVTWDPTATYVNVMKGNFA